jgi:hypothetical protein
MEGICLAYQNEIPSGYLPTLEPKIDPHGNGFLEATNVGAIPDELSLVLGVAQVRISKIRVAQVSPLRPGFPPETASHRVTIQERTIQQVPLGLLYACPADEIPAEGA